MIQKKKLIKSLRDTANILEQSDFKYAYDRLIFIKLYKNTTKLLDKFMDVEHPDFRVYEKRKKRWAPDLVNKEGIRFHCKSQSKASRKKYGPSHILQYGGSGHGHVDKLFTNRTAQDYLISCQVNQEKMYVDVYGAFQVDLIFEKDFIKMPKNEWFKDTKRAIYLEDLTDLPYNDKWGIVFGEEK